MTSSHSAFSFIISQDRSPFVLAVRPLAPKFLLNEKLTSEIGTRQKQKQKQIHALISMEAGLPSSSQLRTDGSKELQDARAFFIYRHRC